MSRTRLMDVELIRDEKSTSSSLPSSELTSNGGSHKESRLLIQREPIPEAALSLVPAPDTPVRGLLQLAIAKHEAVLQTLRVLVGSTGMPLGSIPSLPPPAAIANAPLPANLSVAALPAAHGLATGTSALSASPHKEESTGGLVVALQIKEESPVTSNSRPDLGPRIRVKRETCACITEPPPAPPVYYRRSLRRKRAVLLSQMPTASAIMPAKRNVGPVVGPPSPWPETATEQRKGPPVTPVKRAKVFDEYASDQDDWHDLEAASKKSGHLFQQLFLRFSIDTTHIVSKCQTDPHDFFNVLSSSDRRNAITVNPEQCTVTWHLTNEVICYKARSIRRMMKTKPGPHNFTQLLTTLFPLKFLDSVFDKSNHHGWLFESNKTSPLAARFQMFAEDHMNRAARQLIAYYNQFFRPDDPKRAPRHVIAVALLELTNQPTDYGKFLHERMVSFFSRGNYDLHWQLLGSLFYFQRRYKNKRNA